MLLKCMHLSGTTGGVLATRTSTAQAPNMKQQKVLITGAAGRIGSRLATHWQSKYELVLVDKKVPSDSSADAIASIDLSDFDSLQPLLNGVNTVIHLGADPNPKASWDSLLPNNILATRNVFEAAANAGCQRVIFASSVHTIVAYPPDVQVTTAMPVAPATQYGAAKAFGEAMGRYYAEQRDLSVLCLRIGMLLHDNDPRLVKGHPLLDMAISMPDLLKLFDACMESADVHFGIFHGISDNRFKRLDLSDTRLTLNYEPADDAFAMTGMVDPERPDHLYEIR